MRSSRKLRIVAASTASLSTYTSHPRVGNPDLWRTAHADAHPSAFSCFEAWPLGIVQQPSRRSASRSCSLLPSGFSDRQIRSPLHAHARRNARSCRALRSRRARHTSASGCGERDAEELDAARARAREGVARARARGVHVSKNASVVQLIGSRGVSLHLLISGLVAKFTVAICKPRVRFPADE